MGFTSQCVELGRVGLPAFSHTRIMMMPLVLGDLDSIPRELAHYRDTLDQLFDLQDYFGEVGYLTIDEKEIQPGLTHRRAGLHVDGVYRHGAGSWGGGWGSTATGMLTVASHVGCQAWNQDFSVWPGNEGECEHLRAELTDTAKTVFEANSVYWVHGLCVHESIPQAAPVRRQFVRLSLPSEAPWFDGYTENPLGVKPTGPILPRRNFMDM